MKNSMKDAMAYFQLLNEDFATFQIEMNSNCVFRIYRSDKYWLHVKPILVTTTEKEWLEASGMTSEWNFSAHCLSVYGFFTDGKWRKLSMKEQAEEALR